MAAYAALVSLINNIEQIMNHPRFSTSFDEKQIDSLGEKLNFLLDFVENCDHFHGEAKTLESRIASAAHAAEDVIESRVVDQIHYAESSTISNFFFQQIKALNKNVMHGTLFRSVKLQRIIEDLDAIKEEVMKVKEGKGPTDQQLMSSSRPFTTGKTNNAMVGFDDEKIQIMDVLTGQQSSRQIVSIVGMGGTGKTTLSRTVYETSLIVEHFDVRAWATISQEYNVREILLQLLCKNKITPDQTEEKLGEQLYKSLFGRRYLIVLDDMWCTEVWDKLQFFFPNNGNRSRVVISTRLSNVAIDCRSYCFKMSVLDEDNSWHLFCHKVFGAEECPLELVEIGKKIVEQCRGLPLSIVVIGGLLQKSYRTIEYWQNVAKNINSLLNSRENGECLDVLYLSYSHLPAHLKPCFLYMGTFKEDYEIRVSEIARLWVAEGFIRSNGFQILEEIAEEFLKDLIDRNLVLVCKHGRDGKIKSCRIHDLIRDLCLRVGEEEKFFRVVKTHSSPQGIDRERCLVFHDTSSGSYELFRSALLARSVTGEMVSGIPVMCKLLRVLNESSCLFKFRNVNLRYIALEHDFEPISELPSSISLIWNLQTIVIRNGPPVIAPLVIWEMPQLKHLKCSNIYLPQPPTSCKDDEYIVLRNLQTLVELGNFCLSEEVCKRIPNIKKLRLTYAVSKRNNERLHSSLYNVGRLHKIESLKVWSRLLFRISNSLLRNMLPSSLRKLCLLSCYIQFEHLAVIGTLPQLQVLDLEYNLAEGTWSPVNGGFPRLKFLRISFFPYLTSWTADSSHFPVLEKLVLVELPDLNEIPSDIGEIPTLQLIRLELCSNSAMISAVRIKEEQESLGNDGLKVQLEVHYLRAFKEMVETEGLSINNVQVSYYGMESYIRRPFSTS